MLDFAAVRRGEKTIADLAVGLTVADLRDLTNEMVDHQLAQIASANDADVVFTPVDPGADDPYASNEADRNISWNLGHLIVHVTASSEEGAFIAAEMARGIVRDGRSRSEIPWESVTTIAQCRHRLEESRRMRLAMLDGLAGRALFGRDCPRTGDYPAPQCRGPLPARSLPRRQPSGPDRRSGAPGCGRALIR